MTPAQWGEVKRLFTDAIALPREQVPALLQNVAADVRAEVLSLLGHHKDDDLLATGSSTAALKAAASNPDDPAALLGRAVHIGEPGEGSDVVVEAFVAAGGFGAVYRATRDGRPCALKVFAPQSAAAAEEQRAAFAAEAAVLRSLQDRAPAIVACEGAGVVDGRPCLLLEWIEGRTLAAVLQASRQPWPLSRVLELFAPVADALAVAHDAGVAHRDLKPDNIMVTPRVTLRLLDFGVAKVVGDKDRGFLSTTGTLGMATLRWAAPEQLKRELGATGPWTDVYSFALVVLDLLSGGRAVAETDIGALLVRGQGAQPPQSPRALGVDVSAAVDDAFVAALRSDPRVRTPSLRAFWTALTAR